MEELVQANHGVGGDRKLEIDKLCLEHISLHEELRKSMQQNLSTKRALEESRGENLYTTKVLKAVLLYLQRFRNSRDTRVKGLGRLLNLPSEPVTRDDTTKIPALKGMKKLCGPMLDDMTREVYKLVSDQGGKVWEKLGDGEGWLEDCLEQLENKLLEGDVRRKKAKAAVFDASQAGMHLIPVKMV